MDQSLPRSAQLGLLDNPKAYASVVRHQVLAAKYSSFASPRPAYPTAARQKMLQTLKVRVIVARYQEAIYGLD
jgi:hypothetical protein